MFRAPYLRQGDEIKNDDLENLANIVSRDQAVFGGDLNSRHPNWGGRVKNTNGNKFNEWLTLSANFCFRPTRGPTRITLTSESFIDIVVTTVGMILCGGSVAERGLLTHDYESDPRAIELNFTTGEIEKRETTKLFDYRTFRRDQFNDILVNGLNTCVIPADRNMSAEEIEVASEGVTVAFQNAMKESISISESVRGCMRELRRDIKELIAQKKTLKRRLFKTLELERRITVKAILANADKIIKDAI